MYVAVVYRLPLTSTRSAATLVAIFPVGTAPGATFAFLIVAAADRIAVMTILVVAVHVVTVPLALPPPRPTSLPLDSRS